MRYLLFVLCLFLVGCSDNNVMRHSLAKGNPGHKICYNVLSPEKIRGWFCIEYIGEQKQ